MIWQSHDCYRNNFKIRTTFTNRSLWGRKKETLFVKVIWHTNYISGRAVFHYKRRVVISLKFYSKKALNFLSIFWFGET